jgi:hypothetical protein
MPLVTFQISFNTGASPRLLAGNWTESLLLIDEPDPSSLFPCETATGSCVGWGNGSGNDYYGNGPQSPAIPNVRNIYQGQAVAPNTIAWVGVPFDPPGASFTRVFRFTNLRLNAVGLSGSGPSVPALASVTVTPAIPITNPVVTVGITQPGLAATVRDASSTSAAPDGVIIPTSAGGNVVRIATLRFAELFSSVFRRRNAATSASPDVSPPPINQDAVGLPSPSETGFYSNTLLNLTSVGRGNLALAGLADTGMRLSARFTNVPAGVTLFAALYNDTSQPLGTATELARLVSTDSSGAGQFSAIPGAGMAAIPISSGAGNAVWEVLRSSLAASSNFEFGIFATYTATAGVGLEPIQVMLNAAPISSISTAFPTAPLPRFRDAATSVPFGMFTPPEQPIFYLDVSPSVMRFTVPEGQTPPAQYMTITSTPGPVSYTLAPEVFFPMTLEKLSGTTPDRVAVTPNSAKLAAGTYRQFIRGYSGRAQNSPVLVEVELIVTPVLRLISISPEAIAPGGSGFTLTGTGANVPPRSILRWNSEGLVTTTAGSQLVAQVPSRLYSQPGIAQISIQAPDGRVSNELPFTVAQPIEITSLDPNPVTATRPGFDLTIRGSGFLAGASVMLGSTAAAAKSVTGTAIVVAVPASLVAQAGEVPVKVTNPNKIMSNTATLAVLPPPTVSRIDLPCADAGITNAATIFGANFTRDSKVQVNGQTVTTSFLDAGRLSAQIPGSMLTGLRSVSITVVSADGISSAAIALAVCEPIGVSSTGVATGDTNAIVTIRGTGFQPGSRVCMKRDDGQEATVDPISLTLTEIRAQIPPSLLDRTSTIRVCVVPPSGPPSSSVPVPVNPAPRLTALSRLSAPVGGGAFTLTATGTNLLDGSTLFWNSTSLVTQSGGGQLIGAVPASLLTMPGTASISATGPGGSRTNILAFEVTLPALPAVNYTGPATSASAQVVEVAFAVATPYPVAVRVRMTAGFMASGQLPDDPLVQFSNGMRQIDVMIPANSTAPARAMLQTGATAGAISVTPQFFADAANITPPGTAVRTIQIASAAPILVTLDCIRASATQLTVVADGLTNTREARQASFGFTAAAGETISAGQIPIDASALFNTWFASAPSRAQGGNFRYTQNFNIQGSSSGVAGVSLNLTNQVGASSTVNANCRQP